MLYPGIINWLRNTGCHYPPGLTDPKAMKRKTVTSIQKWMNQAQVKPRVSSIDLPISQPGMNARRTPAIP